MGYIIAIVVIVVLVIIYAVMYNGLINLRTHAEEAWSQIDVQLQRRSDLIPNLVNTVKGYANFERGTLEKVTQYRQQVNNTDDHQEKMAASDKLTGALNNLYAVAENYPDLKASDDFTKLMEELSNTENKIAYSRQLYNSTAASFNAKIQNFPQNILAKVHHFTKLEYLEVPEESKEAPKVNFDDLN